MHPDTPQARLIQQAVKIIQQGGVIVYPTDSCFALGCAIGDKAALDRIRQIRRLGPGHNFTLACRDLSEIGTYARVENAAYRLLRAHTPGPYTFVLKATSEVPRRLQHPKRRTIGIRVPAHPVAAALLQALGEPLMSTTLLLPGQDLPWTEAADIVDAIGHQVDLVIDAGPCDVEPSSVIDLHEGLPVVLRHGKGDTSAFDR
jgi:tRNA threonylcarbamoyl adenosine modification protein (Sua5/YciO/YrdC/YwlC family)